MNTCVDHISNNQTTAYDGTGNVTLLTCQPIHMILLLPIHVDVLFLLQYFQITLRTIGTERDKG